VSRLGLPLMAFSPLSTQKVSAIQRKNFSLNCYAWF
jgi:hypothetical protein